VIRPGEEDEANALETIRTMEESANCRLKEILGVADAGGFDIPVVTEVDGQGSEECFNVMRQADRARHAIARGAAPAAFLAGFAMAKAAGNFAVIGLLNGDGTLKGARTTKMLHSVTPGQQAKMIEHYKALRARSGFMSTTEAVARTAQEFKVSLGTVRKYLTNDLLSE
jgi:hypothetical protein